MSKEQQEQQDNKVKQVDNLETKSTNKVKEEQVENTDNLELSAVTFDITDTPSLLVKDSVIETLVELNKVDKMLDKIGSTEKSDKIDKSKDRGQEDTHRGTEASNRTNVINLEKRIDKLEKKYDLTQEAKTLPHFNKDKSTLTKVQLEELRLNLEQQLNKQQETQGNQDKTGEKVTINVSKYMGGTTSPYKEPLFITDTFGKPGKSKYFEPELILSKQANTPGVLGEPQDNLGSSLPNNDQLEIIHKETAERQRGFFEAVQNEVVDHNVKVQDEPIDMDEIVNKMIDIQLTDTQKGILEKTRKNYGKDSIRYKQMQRGLRLNILETEIKELKASILDLQRTEYLLTHIEKLEGNKDEQYKMVKKYFLDEFYDDNNYLGYKNYKDYDVGLRKLVKGTGLTLVGVTLLVIAFTRLDVSMYYSFSVIALALGLNIFGVYRVFSIRNKVVNTRARQFLSKVDISQELEELIFDIKIQKEGLVDNLVATESSYRTIRGTAY